ncbi:hypothetical protein [Butyrivibrio sp. AE3004]|uniref:hypothetical protein n=1 Tax=Butyrivibrio sp. AE3004 TaxID=1506994 RepID=UPI000493F4D0|nr:hypothetical protein [Butyrivibrio sp. AE3004]
MKCGEENVKETRAKRLIELSGGLFNVNYDKKTYKNIEKILKCYKFYMQNRDMFNYGVMGKDSLEKVAPFVYRHFISETEIEQAAVDKMVMQILNDEKTEGILYDTLEELKKFKVNAPTEEEANLGMLYYNILDMLYVSEEDYNNTDVYLALDLDSHKFSYRKEEAVMLFGIYFWQRCLESLGDWQSLLEKIQKEEGRFDLMLGYGT